MHAYVGERGQQLAADRTATEAHTLLELLINRTERADWTLLCPGAIARPGERRPNREVRQDESFCGSGL